MSFHSAAALVTATSPRPLWQGQLVLVCAILLSCFAGIYSRPIGYLAAFWPASAVALGLLLRYPRWARAPSTWALALAAFVVPDAITGSRWELTLGLNVANVIGIACAWAYLSRLTSDVLYLKHQRSVLHLFVGCMLGALGCTLSGAPIAAWVFELPLWRSLAMWLSTEFYSFILIVPVFLAAPRAWIRQWPALWRKTQTGTWKDLLPLAALLLSEAVTMMIGGPGALGFVMPAMVWCAMAYGVFPITVLSLLISYWKTATIAMGVFSFTPDHVLEVLSFRTGMAMLSLAPLAVASAYAMRLQALHKLHHAVNHDYLTGALARRALMERGNRVLSRMKITASPMAVLMLDLDHFKQINDKYGHAHGDLVLQRFVEIAHQSLRPDDLLGRMGGEEFALVLPRASRDQALGIGQRLCEQMRNHPFVLENGSVMHATVSVGMHAVQQPLPGDTLEQFISQADAALYLAKTSGRNQVRQYGPSMAPSSL